MTLTALRGLTSQEALGVLARASLSLGYATKSEEAGAEQNRRKQVEAELRENLGIEQEDYSDEALDLLSEALDVESEHFETLDAEAAFQRMAARGDLPSDLYKINIVKNVEEVYSEDFALEQSIIEATVKSPDTEQHFGAGLSGDTPDMISLFMKNIRTRWPLKDFRMLVAGGRNGLTLDVHQAWRIYDNLIDYGDASTLVDLLRRFTDLYGMDVDFGGRMGRFFLSLEGKIPDQRVFIPAATSGRPQRVSVSFFSQIDSAGKLKASLVTAINITKYRAAIKSLMIKKSDIFTDLGR